MSLQAKLEKLGRRVQSAFLCLTSLEEDARRATVKLSFSQSGEDLILWQLLSRLGIQKPTYLDIGANDPVRYNNTMLFYFLGAEGTNVEPNPKLLARLKRHRPRDRNLRCAVGPQPGQARLHIPSDHTLGTIDSEEARRLAEAEGKETEQQLDVQVRGINELLAELPQVPDLLCLDTEGSDHAILEALNFEAFRPAALCVETLRFSPSTGGTKIEAIPELLKARGYRLIADTFINSIFCAAELLPKTP